MTKRKYSKAERAEIDNAKLFMMAKANAYVSYKLTMDEARQLPGLLGIVIPRRFAEKGWHVCVDEKGERIYELKGWW